MALLDSVACGVMQTRPDGLFLRVNQTFCAWTGHSAQELVGKRRLKELLSVGSRIFLETHWTPLMQMQGSLSEIKLELISKAGPPIPVVLNAIRRERGGEVVHDLAAFVARDRDKYERELLLSRKRLEGLVAESARLEALAKDRQLFAEQMMGIVSHDLRNPLSAVNLGAALLMRGELTPAQKRTVERITRATGRASRLISDLLDFTQARLGKELAISSHPIDLHAAIGTCVEELAFAYPNRAIEHVRAGEGPCVADADRLAQLVGNLVSNAITHGDPASTVTVASSIAAASFSVSVHNDGAPIPAALQATIFQPMVRGAEAGNSSHGVGLGLYIVSEIARSHGGSAQLVSADPGGTTFTASFPRR